MKRTQWLAMGLVVLAATAACISWSVAREPEQEKPPVAELKLPPGFTMEDMQVCVAAGTPGEMQKRLVQGVGTWNADCTMWMSPEADPLKSKGTTVATAIMDGRFVKCEMKGEMPGMGPYTGFGLYGFDNVSQTFQSTWIDNHGTGMAVGKGELSDDGKTLTWTYTFNCPLTKQPAKLREVETITGPDTKTIVSYAPNPKTGKEFKMMSMELTRQEAAK